MGSKNKSGKEVKKGKGGVKPEKKTMENKPKVKPVKNA